MNDTTTLVDRYLDDLARMLTVLPPAERADALGSVREHVDDALAELGRPATADDVTAILERLGTPAEVAAALLDDLGVAAAAPEHAPSPTAPAPEPLPGDSSATLALVLGILALLVPFIGLASAVAAIVVSRRARRLGTRRDGLRLAGLSLGIIALVSQLLLVAGLASLLTLRADTTHDDGGTVIENVVPAP